MYLALYRKYRPKTFDDVISQEHITTTLKNQISSGTAAHAYLFTGSRGTGKTSCAKILAMAVNCLHPVNGNPCLECEACREIESGAATDITEMDAASNNGVDDVRQLRDEVAYTPVSCRYRVYIIDEVHMLSLQAFNALLKTLEEPPEHVKFILATTELHKVPATILSRCQRFEFRRIDTADSAERLLNVAEKEGVTLDRDAAELISRLSDGGMRDALSVLDRCISADGHVTTELVRSCAGVADTRHLFAFSEMTANRDVSGCIRLLNELHKGSKDIARIIDELSGHYRDLMLFKTAPADKELLSAMPDEYPEVERICGMYDLNDILRCLSLLQQCADDIGKTKQRKTLAEMCLVKMCLGLGAQSGSADVPPATAAKPNAAVSAPPPVVNIVTAESPQEEFTPTPPEKMSKQEAANLAKLRELSRETMQIVKNTAGDPEPPPELNSAPAPDLYAPAPEDYGAPPPDYDYVPPEQTDGAPPKKAKPDDKPKAEAPAKTEPEVGVISNITPEQWKAAVEKLDDMNRAMLTDSEAEINGNTLTVRSASNMLNSMKDEPLRTLERELSEVLGGKIKLKTQRKEAAESAPTAVNAVDRLLEKAKRLNIEIIYK